MTAGRLVVRWDVATAGPAQVDRWLAAARSRRIRPLVVFADDTQITVADLTTGEVVSRDTCPETSQRWS